MEIGRDERCLYATGRKREMARFLEELVRRLPGPSDHELVKTLLDQQAHSEELIQYNISPTARIYYSQNHVLLQPNSPENMWDFWIETYLPTWGEAIAHVQLD